MSEIPEQVLEKIQEAKERDLTELNLRGYRLTELPESIGQLQSLTELYLTSNRLTELPESITQLQGLTILRLKGNPIDFPPPEVVRKGIEAIKNYIRQFEAKGEDYKFESLKKRISDRRYEVECGISYEMVNVLGLIDDVMEKMPFFRNF